MKKAQEKRMVLVEMTKGQIKDWVGRKETRGTWKFWTTLIASLLIAGLFCCSSAESGSMFSYIGLGLVVLCLIPYVVWGARLSKAGNRLWEKVKDEKEPIKL